MIWNLESGIWNHTKGPGDARLPAAAGSPRAPDLGGGGGGIVRPRAPRDAGARPAAIPRERLADLSPGLLSGGRVPALGRDPRGAGPRAVPGDPARRVDPRVGRGSGRPRRARDAP